MTRHGVATRRPSHTRPGDAARPQYLRSPAKPEVAEPADPLGREPAVARVEAALMLADEPLTAKRLADVTGLADAKAAKAAVDTLKNLYTAGDSAFQIHELAGGFQLLTLPRFDPWLVRLRRTGYDFKLSPAALETLAVVAYKQPLTRADVETIRGVACGELIQVLMEKGLVRVGGRHDSLGRPHLFVTTRRFLQAFGMNTLADLPEVESLKKPRASS